MTQEEKQLLLQDLCVRLPYRLRGKSKDGKLYEATVIYDTGTILASEVDGVNANICCGFKPYLRPMSSMTEEETRKITELSGILTSSENILSISVKEEFIDIKIDDGVCSTETRTLWFTEMPTSIKMFDYLNARHFDYRGLIKQGLALKAPEEMYKN